MNLNLTDPTGRLVRLLAAAVTVGAILAPASLATAQPWPGPGDLTDDPCEPALEDCSPDPDPDPGLDDITADPCEPAFEDCSPDPDPDPEPEPEPDPDPEPVDPPVVGQPNFTG